jgi:hypothetical protein
MDARLKLCSLLLAALVLCGLPCARGEEATATNLWSWRSIARPAIPAGAANPIDAFINTRLRAESISPAPTADRRTLIRRLSFDLHGLPPSPKEVDAFEKDGNPRAYENLVARLLDSPRYGERWARHWLDAIHFADSHGFEHDLMRTNAWRYRDYVIESLNRDTPWPRFIREQLAPDFFFPDEPRLMAGLGFIGAGPWDQSTAQTAPKTSDNLDRDDMVTQTMSSFASVTAHCARCHDHKFDPVLQEDYYALQAVFAGVGKGDVAYDRDAATAEQRRRWKQLVAAIDRQDRGVLLANENAQLVSDWANARGPEAAWNIVEPETFLNTSAAKLKRLPDGAILAEGPLPEVDTYTVTAAAREITAVRLEILTDASLPKNGPGRAENGNLHLSEFEIQLFEPGAASARKIAIRKATADFNQESWTIPHAIDGDEKTAWGIHPREGESHTAVFELETKLALTNGARVAFVLKQVHGRGHVVGKFRLATTSDDPARATVLPASVSAALATTNQNEAQQLALASFALREITGAKLAALPKPEVVFAAGPDFTSVSEGMTVKPWSEPKVVHVLKRGEISRPGAIAEPGTIHVSDRLQSRFAAKNEAERRAALADWLADKENPLTWRSAVNRVWHHHFGRGLVDTLNDFGHMGSAPTHPELLDWLAAEFRDTGGSLKALHRLIVTSETYQRANAVNDHALAADPENRLLWHGVRRRLDAESFRDAVLAISGRLDTTMGGPAAQQFKLGKPIQLTPTVDYTPFAWDSPGANRRSIYRFVYRGLQDPFMDALDFPDAAQLAPTRLFSASPLQSLALLNNDFVLHHAQALGSRLEASSHTRAEQIREAFRLVFQRDATESEVSAFGAYAEKHGLPPMARVLFNSSEFLFVN